MTIYILGALTILLPFSLIMWLAFGTVRNKTEWLLRLLLVASIILIFYKLGLWSVSSYYLRIVMLVFFSGAMLYSFLNIHTLSWHILAKHWYRLGSTAVLVLLGLFLSVFVFSGGFYSSGNTIDLKFPLAQGKYYVMQGGSNIMTNPFHSQVPSAKYAIDIVKLNSFGNRAGNLFPVKLTQYHIFAETVYSPCKGRVVKAVSSLPDNLPTKIDLINPAGNHVEIECKNISVVLAHLKQNSVKISKGEEVVKGQPIGEAGNSGYTDEPHLHIQAYTLAGEAVVLRFDGRYLSVNDLYVAK